MGSEKQYRESVEVQTFSENGSDGERVIRAVIRGDKSLFDTTALLEERGGVKPLTERIERAIRDEVVSSFLEVDSFFKLVRAQNSRRKKTSQSERETNEEAKT